MASTTLALPSILLYFYVLSVCHRYLYYILRFDRWGGADIADRQKTKKKKEAVATYRDKATTSSAILFSFSFSFMPAHSGPCVYSYLSFVPFGITTQEVFLVPFFLFYFL
ncbi:hypothetical protein BC939DRAFT_469011 [Gamsiella multidivaricata]|uniref:uncharacterized protein n=1 Tax=Gamsiella multidivaricata TaxID=101098 RepID=UPI0022201ECF|nr:uncharacterized protein BC939DRAFT_469011 [Gamsiella multidivaricata]KAI7816474.1 hypothetical protein BC939DRAFT_469011 [Gamsiella multidivaricata]